MAVLASGCDFVFRLDTIEIHDGGPADTHADGGSGDAAPAFEAGGWIAHPGDGTLYNSVAVTLDRPTERGDVVVVALCAFPTASPITVSDALSTAYTHVAVADAASAQPQLAAKLYYGVAPEAAAALEVDLAFGGAGVESPDVRVAAYRNLAQAAPLATATGVGAENVDTLQATVMVSAVPTLLVAATCVGAETTSVEGFQVRALSQPNGDLLADSISDSVSDEIATAHQSSATGMIVQLAAFRGASAR